MFATRHPPPAAARAFSPRTARPGPFAPASVRGPSRVKVVHSPLLPHWTLLPLLTRWARRRGPRPRSGSRGEVREANSPVDAPPDDLDDEAHGPARLTEHGAELFWANSPVDVPRLDDEAGLSAAGRASRILRSTPWWRCARPRMAVGNV
ncbi:unnamed protein product [Durusdinium trenchii]|uniref:Uncharacterized protein n=1 Tax=Durusdinium trenchii TaxID=1381693 RepID=A0ABP0N7C1_9DINO